MTSPTLPRTRISLSRNAVAITLATLGALALWCVETRVLGADLTVGTGTGAHQVSGTAVALTALVAGLAGTTTAWLLTRMAPRRAARIWLVLAGGVLVVSLLGPLGAATAGAVAALLALHLLVGLVLIVGLRPQRGYGG